LQQWNRRGIVTGKAQNGNFLGIFEIRTKSKLELPQLPDLPVGSAFCRKPSPAKWKGPGIWIRMTAEKS